MITKQQALEALEALKHAGPDGWGPIEFFTTLRAYIEQAEPSGFVMVPVEPTDDMQASGAVSVRFNTTMLNKIWMANAVYRAMLEAAPKEPTK